MLIVIKFIGLINNRFRLVYCRVQRTRNIPITINGQNHDGFVSLFTISISVIRCARQYTHINKNLL